MKKTKSKFNYKINPETGVEIGCKFESNGWCNLPKYKRCLDSSKNYDGSKSCNVTT